jgi:hypothetical protein
MVGDDAIKSSLANSGEERKTLIFVEDFPCSTNPKGFNSTEVERLLAGLT